MEKIMVGAEEALPTLRGPLEIGKLMALEEPFRTGRHLELPPVELLRTTSGLLLVLNGHHRLTQSLIYNVGINGDAYQEGDALQTARGVVKFDDVTIQRIEFNRVLAVEVGHLTLADLYRLSFPIDRFLRGFGFRRNL